MSTIIPRQLINLLTIDIGILDICRCYNTLYLHIGISRVHIVCRYVEIYCCCCIYIVTIVNQWRGELGLIKVVEKVLKDRPLGGYAHMPL